MDRRQDGTAARFAAGLVPVRGGSTSPHQDARLRDERRGAMPPVARRRCLICGPGQRSERRSAIRDPRAAALARPNPPHPGRPAHVAAAGPSTHPRRF